MLPLAGTQVLDHRRLPDTASFLASCKRWGKGSAIMPGVDLIQLHRALLGFMKGEGVAAPSRGDWFQGDDVQCEAVEMTNEQNTQHRLADTCVGAGDEKDPVFG
jgi:hypothetical protein